MIFSICILVLVVAVRQRHIGLIAGICLHLSLGKELGRRLRILDLQAGIADLAVEELVEMTGLDEERAREKGFSVLLGS